MVIGACGVSCDVCRLFVCGICPGCVAGDRYQPLKASAMACPILECAMAKGIGYCTRDCDEYPCALCSGGLPICTRNSTLALQVPLDEMPSAWSRLGLRWIGPKSGRRVEYRSAELLVFLLGPLRVYVGGKRVSEAAWGQGKGPAQKVKALFAFLLTRGETGASKDEVFELLWRGEGNGQRIQARFHAAIYYLRRALEPDLPARGSSRFVLHEEGRYRLITPGGCWIDSQAFEAYYRNAMRLAHAGQPDLEARNLKLAEALYQGKYMAGIGASYAQSFDQDWCQLERYRLAGLYGNVLLRLARYHEQRGEHRQALLYAQKALAEDPGNEEGHRFLMQLYHRTGRWADVVRQFESCERHLRQAEDRAPEARTLELYQDLLEVSSSRPVH